MGKRALPVIVALLPLVATSGCGGGSKAPDGGPVQCTGTLSGDLSGSFLCTTPTYELVSGAYYTLSLSSKPGALSASSNLSGCSVSLIKDQSGFVVGQTYRDLNLDGMGTASAVTLTGRSYGGSTGAGTPKPVIVALTLTSVDMPSATGPASNTHGTIDVTMPETTGTGKLIVHFNF
jgi:hypothetical protein